MKTLNPKYPGIILSGKSKMAIKILALKDVSGILLQFLELLENPFTFHCCNSE